MYYFLHYKNHQTLKLAALLIWAVIVIMGFYFDASVILIYTMHHSNFDCGFRIKHVLHFCLKTSTEEYRKKVDLINIVT